MQKTYVNDERKQVKNRGQVNSWYAENDHVPIVSKRLWQKAQDALRDRRHYRLARWTLKRLHRRTTHTMDGSSAHIAGSPFTQENTAKATCLTGAALVRNDMGLTSATALTF